MARRHDRAHFYTQERIGSDIFRNRWKKQANANRRGVISKPAQGATQAFRRKTDGKIREILPQRVQALDEWRSRYERIDRNHKLGFQALARSRRCRFETRCTGQNQARLFYQYSTGIGQQWAVRTAIEQDNTLSSFERCDGLADCRLNAPKAPTRGRKASCIHDGDENT